MNESYLDKFARLTIELGINLKKGQPIVIRSSTDPELVKFARKCAKAAWKAGASDVWMDWRDSEISALEYANKDLEAFKTAPGWKADFYESAARNNAAFLFIDGDDPEAFANSDPAKMVTARMAMNSATPDYRSGIDNGSLAWCVVAAPSAGWAKKVYPDLDEEDVVETLWQDIFRISRINENDPIENWMQHGARLNAQMDRLNQAGIVKFHYTSSNGTDLWVDMPEGAIFVGGASKLADGRENFCNIPTEELFSAPALDGVNGRLEAVFPLNENGKLVEGFGFTFKDGKVVDYHASKGKEVLDALLKGGEGADRLGEIALVDKSSPIRQGSRIYYNTLYDENAACHFALGQSYAECLPGGQTMSKEDLKQHKMNQSEIHVDFMVGADDLNIDGYTKEGKLIPVFRNGSFTAEFDL